MILIVDFGGQTTHLIQRRVKDFGVDSKIIHPEEILKTLKYQKVTGLILSGGPSSVYSKNAPDISPKIFNQNIPILGICYGFQLAAKILDGKVIAGKKEYGPAKISVVNHKSSTPIESGSIINQIPEEFVVWMSHGDEVVKLPEGFQVIGSTEHVPFAFVQNLKANIFGVQFHPEVDHTEFGNEILKNFLEICGKEIKSEKINIRKIENEIKETVGNNIVIGAVSGGVDSTVAAALTANAIGKQFIPIYVDNGLMRNDTTKFVEIIFKKIGIKPIILRCENEMLKRLKGIVDPEKKRTIIGNFFIELFEKEMNRLIKNGKQVKFLLQGTIYSDVIESKGTKNSAKIKSHHNVGGLPKNMKLKLLEPLRHFYKDEVRLIGKELKLPDEFIHRQTFPGPGYAVRIRGEVTKKRLGQERIADKIVFEELEKNNLLDQIFMSFSVLTGAESTAVKGDGRFFGEVVAVRIVESKDVMTSTWAKIPYEVLQKISSRIVNEIPGISRVVYDITTKPPATMEWE